MKTVRDLINTAMLRCGACSPSTMPSYEESNVFMESLQLAITELRLRKLANPAISQRKIPLPANKEQPDFSKIKFLDTRSTEWREKSLHEKEEIMHNPLWVLVDGRPLRPSSVSIAYPGQSELFQPARYISPDALFALRGTVAGDYRYPINWTWQAGKHPELLILSRVIQPEAILVNALFDQYAGLELDSSLDCWPEGLPLVVSAYLEWKILEAEGVGNPEAKRREAFRVLDIYEDTAKQPQTVGLDPTLPGIKRGGRGVVNDYANLTGSIIYGGL